MTEPTSGPEPTEERRPTSDSFQQFALDLLADFPKWMSDAERERLVPLLESRRDALLAAEPEQDPSEATAIATLHGIGWSWMSICSAHRAYESGCPRCATGGWYQPEPEHRPDT